MPRIRGEEEIVVWGDGSPTREFFYVEDAAGAIVPAAEKYGKGNPVNRASGFETSIKSFGDNIAELTEYNANVTWHTGKPNVRLGRYPAAARGERGFGFKVKMDSNDGLKRTIDSYCKKGRRIVD